MCTLRARDERRKVATIGSPTPLYHDTRRVDGSVHASMHGLDARTDGPKFKRCVLRVQSRSLPRNMRPPDRTSIHAQCTSWIMLASRVTSATCNPAACNVLRHAVHSWRAAPDHGGEAAQDAWELVLREELVAPDDAHLVVQACMHVSSVLYVHIVCERARGMS